MEQVVKMTVCQFWPEPVGSVILAWFCNWLQGHPTDKFFYAFLETMLIPEWLQC